MIRLALLAVLCAACEPVYEVAPPQPTPTPVVPVPAPPDASTVVRQTACDVIVIALTARGVWLGAPPDLRCFAPNIASTLDADWLRAELHRLRGALDRSCQPVIELAADGDVSYQDVVNAMDLALATGFRDIGTTSPDDLAVRFGAPPAAATTCPKPSPVGPTPRTTSAPRSPSQTIQDATVVIITRTDIRVGNKLVLPTPAAAQGTGTIAELASALGTPPAGTIGTIILQADRETPAKVMNRVLATAKARGFENVLFAAK